MKRQRLRVFCIILSILAFVLAFIVFDQRVGSFESSKSYGGDAYTGIQNAAAQTANNVQDVGEMIRTGLGCILILHGAILLSVAICIDVPKKEKIQPVAEQPFTGFPIQYQ